MDQEKIGKFIRDIRKNNFLTQQQFADKYGVTYQAVSKWENGKNMPDMALIKQICNDYNINIEELLNGEYVPKKNHSKVLMIIIIILLIIFIIALFFLINNNSDFEFKTLSSECDKFNISGSISYNNNKSSIHISNIKYCGGTDETEYKNIECNLYEKNNNLESKISSCTYEKDGTIKLEEYLQNITILVDNYQRVCKDYSDNSLYLQINATNKNDQVITYKIPLNINDSCNN